MSNDEVTTIHKGRRIGVSRNGQAVGWSVLVKPGGPWNAQAKIDVAPFDVFLGVYASADEAIAAIAAFRA